jgi:hypothetical protein
LKLFYEKRHHVYTTYSWCENMFSSLNIDIYVSFHKTGGTWWMLHVSIIPHVQTQSNRVCNSLVILLWLMLQRYHFVSIFVYLGKCCVRSSKLYINMYMYTIMPHFKIGKCYFGIRLLPTKGHWIFKCLRSMLPNNILCQYYT